MNKKIIIIIRSTGTQKLKVVKIAKDMGYEIAIAAEKGFKDTDKIFDYIIDTDVNNIDALVTDIAEFELQHDVIAILSFTEFGIEYSATISNILGYSGLSFKAAKICRNKFLTRSELKKHDLPSPKFLKVKNLEEMKKGIENIGVPVIIKPLNLAASCATVKINNINEIKEMYARLREMRKKSPVVGIMNDTIENYWIVEEYLEGFEISVETFTFNGETTIVAIHDKMCVVEAPYFLEEFFVTPSPRIDANLAKQIEDLTKKSLKSIGFNLGLSHVEYRITEKGPLLIEINGRLGGGLIGESVYISTGVNMYEVLLKMHLGIKPEVNIEQHNPVAFQMIVCPEGTVKSVIGFDEAMKNNKLKIVDQRIKVGDIVKARQADYGGWILATGDNLDEIINNVQEASAKIKFFVD